jgi:glutamyl-tRNA synthetase
MENRRVRVRFAPSPTGPLHMGGVRTALYNYLFAKKHGGDFILRVEDTDQGRFVPGAEQYIIEALKWCGIEPNEGIGFGDGPHAPYRQSERKAMYRQYAMQLIESGHAYYAFDTSEELEDMRKKLEAAKAVSSAYNAVTRANMKNSLTLPEDEVKRRLDAGDPYVIRIKLPRAEEVRFHDIIRGWVVVHTSNMDDKVLFKSDGMPTYHLANIVDDYLMQVTHVIRGEEWLPSAPLHVLLYRYLGWEDVMPQFAHLPLLLKPDGNGKLSKRDGDRLGFPVFPLNWVDPTTGEQSSGYRERGYYPDAFINMLALLGWNPGTQQEIFTLAELCEAFSLERVSKSGAKFDPEKTKWFNQQYLRAKDNAELALEYLPELTAKGYNPDMEILARICGMAKERSTFIADFWENSWFFFQAPDKYDETTVQKKWNADAAGLLNELAARFEGITDFTHDNVHNAFTTFLEDKGLKIGAMLPLFRLSVTGLGQGPGMFDVAEIVGKEETLARVNRAITALG